MIESGHFRREAHMVFHITNSHPAFIEGLYQQFLTDPASVDPDIIKFFEGFDFALQNGTAAPVQSIASSASNAAIVDSPPSKEKRFCPIYFV